VPDLRDFDDSELSQRRVCRSCETIYTIRSFLERHERMFSQPEDYRSGCEEYCLACWLGVGPLDFPDTNLEPDASNPETMTEGQTHDAEITDNGPESEIDNDEQDLLSRYRPFLNEGYLLAVMPISRVFVEGSPIIYRNLFTFVPPGFANLPRLNIVPNRETGCSLAEGQSAASRLTEELLSDLTLVVFPCRGELGKIINASHEEHLDLIRELSENVDRSCLNFVRYRLCGFEPIDTLPGRAGQIHSNSMMSGLCLYDPMSKQSRIFGGAAFTHMITRGLGLELERIDRNEFSRMGEVGNIVEHALSLYSNAIEAGTATSRFVQALGLLEFLAYPSDINQHHKFEDVKKVISRYIAKNSEEYRFLLDRFHELTGLKDKNMGKIVGIRTRVVHKGEQLEKILPDRQQRIELFHELDRYIRAVIDHMIRHSELTFEEYEKKRDLLRPFEV
jgi:hypothetical protein